MLSNESRADEEKGVTRTGLADQRSGLEDDKTRRRGLERTLLLLLLPLLLLLLLQLLSGCFPAVLIPTCATE